MAAYATHIPFSTIGTRGSTTYIDQAVEDIRDTFDFVVCSNVLDHTGDWIDFLAHCCNRVGAGGELLLFTNSRGAPTPGHTQIFSPPQLLKVIELLGAKRFVAPARRQSLTCTATSRISCARCSRASRAQRVLRIRATVGPLASPCSRLSLVGVFA